MSEIQSGTLLATINRLAYPLHERARVALYMLRGSAMLKFEVDSLEGLDESVKGLYEQKGERFRLKVEGIDPADELKEALRKERDERRAAKDKLAEFEKAQTESEAKRLEETQQFESLYKNTKGELEKRTSELDEFRRKIADKERGELATQLANALSRDTGKAELLKKEALAFIQHTSDGVVISGPDGTMTAEQLGKHLTERYPFLVDGNQSSGGGATGSNSSGGAVKKFEELTGAELSAIRQKDPAQYDRLKADHTARTRGY